MKGRGWAAWLAVLATTSAVGQGASGESCARIEDEPRRLICYDLVFRVGSTTLGSGVPGQGVPQPVEGWPMSTGPSRLGDGQAISIATLSTKPITEDEQLARLTVSCDDDRTSVTFNFSGYFMSESNGGNVLIARLDQGEAQELTTLASESVMILFGGDKSIPFLRALSGGETLRLVAQPTSGPQVEAEFSLSGFDQAIVPIQQACGWS